MRYDITSPAIGELSEVRFVDAGRRLIVLCVLCRTCQFIQSETLSRLQVLGDLQIIAVKA